MVAPLRKGWDPIRADMPLLATGNIFSPNFPQSCSLRAFTGTRPVLRGMAYRRSLVRSTFRCLVSRTLCHAVASLHADFTQTKPRWGCRFTGSGAVPKSNHQRLLWCIGGSNSPWSEFVCGHGSCLLTKRGSKKHRHRPNRTKISNLSSVQTQGVPISPLQWLSEYTPHTPSSGTLS